MRVSSAMSDNGITQAIKRDFQSSMTEHYRSHLDGTNINTQTMLTTDYLNHFSGVLMLLEMLPMDPDGLAEDVLGWEPKTYEEHFEVTGFRDKELAVKAYEHAPVDVREVFDAVVDQMNGVLRELMKEVRLGIETEDTAQVCELCTRVTPQLRELIDKAAHIVNMGTTNVVELHPDPSDEDIEETAQSEVDALFDQI